METLQKYEKVASVAETTKEFDATRKKTVDLITASEALIQYEQLAGLTGRRTLQLGIGVPPAKFDAFIDDARKLATLTSLTIVKNDKTNEFRELRAKRETLEKARKALTDLAGSGGSVDERLKVQAQLTDIEQKIQDLGVSLGDFDSQNEFCTVLLAMNENLGAPRHTVVQTPVLRIRLGDLALFQPGGRLSHAMDRLLDKLARLGHGRARDADIGSGRIGGGAMETRAAKLHSSWRERLKDEFESSYFAGLCDFVRREYADETVYPAPENIYRAFDLCPFDNVRVVVLGQDPYHGPGQANGLCFAVEEDIKLPPSLKNIFKEIESDLGMPLIHKSGDLTRWAKQGVLLLNATLTVRAHTPSSHQKQGWEKFTDATVRALSEHRDNLVFMLWGAYAKAKGAHIDRTRHCVLEAGHPSPLSVRSFLGCKHFSKANAYLETHGKPAIDWL